MRLLVHKILLVIWILSLPLVCQAQDFSSAKQTIDNFLHNWLVAKNMKLVKNDFAQKLYTSKFLLDDGCLNVKITDNERKSPKKLKQKAIEFLLDITNQAQGKSLKEILSLDSTKIDDLFNVKEDELMSSLKEDKYVLKKLTNIDDEDIKYIKSKFPSSEGYLLLGVLIKSKNVDNAFDYPIFIMWAKEKGSWKVFHFGVPCF